MTTLHGDPDMYVSTKQNVTSLIYDKRSTNSGIYPDVIEFKKTAKQNLTKNFYVLVEGWEESTYIITYFTKTENGTAGIQKLMVGNR